MKLHNPSPCIAIINIEDLFLFQGVFFPFGNARGTVTGAIIALILVHILSVGYQINGPSQDPLPPMSPSCKGSALFNGNVKVQKNEQ